MANKCRNLKPTWELAVVILILLAPLMSPADAGTWRDDFEDDDFDGWALRNPNSVWTVRDSFLHAEVRAPGLRGTADFLEFTAFEGPYERFTVTLTNPSFGMKIGLGKMFPGPVAGRSDFYLYCFSAYKISAFRINRFGGPAFVAGFRGGWLPKNPGTIWREKVVNLTVHFDAGRFQFFADGQLRADFEDSHFDQIEFITILIMAPDGASEQVDAFEISGPGIGGMAVQPKRKLAATWGHLKR